MQQLQFVVNIQIPHRQHVTNLYE